MAPSYSLRVSASHLSRSTALIAAVAADPTAAGLTNEVDERAVLRIALELGLRELERKHPLTLSAPSGTKGAGQEPRSPAPAEQRLDERGAALPPLGVRSDA